MDKSTHLLPLLVSLALSVASLAIVRDAHALRSYRCYGRVQYRPCTELPQHSSSHSAAVASRSYAKVIRSEFSELPEHEGIWREGIWRGAVAGNGTVHLRLVIKRNGIIQSTRYMGNVALLDKTTTFAFKSVTPSGNDWSWDIVAYNG